MIGKWKSKPGGMKRAFCDQQEASAGWGGGRQQEGLKEAQGGREMPGASGVGEDSTDQFRRWVRTGLGGGQRGRVLRNPGLP